MICFRDFFFGRLPCPRSIQAIEVAAAYLGERRVLRARLVAAVAQPFRRGTPDLARRSMRGFGRLRDGVRSSEEGHDRCSCTCFQSLTPAQQRRNMFLIGIVTLIAHGSVLITRN